MNKEESLIAKSVSIQNGYAYAIAYVSYASDYVNNHIPIVLYRGCGDNELVARIQDALLETNKDVAMAYARETAIDPYYKQEKRVMTPYLVQVKVDYEPCHIEEVNI